MLKEFTILKTIITFILSYILLYSIYIQLNGEISPGGGFQAGVIFSTGFIGYDLIYGNKKLKSYFSTNFLIINSTLGVAIYALTGLLSLIYNDNYLTYSSISEKNIVGQHICIFLIELGVGITVYSVMLLIYSLLRKDTF